MVIGKEESSGRYCCTFWLWTIIWVIWWYVNNVYLYILNAVRCRCVRSYVRNGGHG